MEPTLKLGLSSVTVYGREFKFPRKGTDPRHFQLRDEATAKATAYGKQVLNAMRSQKGTPLSTREVVTGRLDAPNEPKPIEHVGQQPPDPDENPFGRRLSELRRQQPLLAPDKAQRDRRVEKLQQLSDRWEANRSIERLVEAHDADPRVANARQNAQHCLDHVRLDPRATPAEIAERTRLHGLINVPLADPGEYWTQASQADKAWFSRLDAIAAEKKTAVTAAQAEASEARAIAREARQTDLGAEQSEETPAV